MRRIGLTLFSAVVFIAPQAFACGDKYVVFGQGVRFQRAYAAAHPGAILVYLKSSTPEVRDRLLTVLRLVGHRPQAVSTTEELAAAIATGAFDVVLAEPSEVAALAQPLASARVRPTVVQLLFNPTREDLARYEQQNTCAAPVTRRNHELLTVINDVMDQRAKGAIKVACQRRKIT